MLLRWLVFIFLIKLIRSTKCHDNWLFYMDKCYLFTEQTMSFVEGIHFCNELDSNLIQLDTRLKNNFILSQIKKDSWIGCASISHFNYKWITSQRKVINYFTNWQELEPTCSKCCVKISMNRGNQWFTEHCNKDNSVICERDPHFSSKLLKKLKLSNEINFSKFFQLNITNLYSNSSK